MWDGIFTIDGFGKFYEQKLKDDIMHCAHGRYHFYVIPKSAIDNASGLHTAENGGIYIGFHDCIKYAFRYSGSVGVESYGEAYVGMADRHIEHDGEIRGWAERINEDHEHGKMKGGWWKNKLDYVFVFATTDHDWSSIKYGGNGKLDYLEDRFYHEALEAKTYVNMNAEDPVDGDDSEPEFYPVYEQNPNLDRKTVAELNYFFEMAKAIMKHYGNRLLG